MAIPADRRILPQAQAVLTDRQGRATPQFYDFLRRLIEATSLTPELEAQIQQILALIAQIEAGGFIPITANVVGQQSIFSQGSLPAGDVVLLSLINDTPEQRATWYYGSDETSAKGWHRFYTALAGGFGILKRNSGYIELGEVNDPGDIPGAGNVGEAYWVHGVNDVSSRGLWAWSGAAWVLDAAATGIVSFLVDESFSPTWSADHNWLDGVAATFGDGGELSLSYDGADALIGTAAGDLLLGSSAGDIGIAAADAVDIAADTDIVLTTNGVERIRVTLDGELELAGDPGTTAQVLTSNGPGTDPTWEDAGGGGALVYVNTTIPAGNTVANTTTETAFTSTYDIPTNTLAVGSVIRIKLWGTYSTDAVLAPTIRGRLKLDATTVIDTGTITAIIGATNRGWSGEAQLVVTATGGSGSVDSQGLVEFSTAATAALLVNAPNTAGIAVDTTQALTASVTVQWGTADADNTITLRQMAIWLEAAALPTTTPSMTFVGSAEVTGAAATNLTISGLDLTADEHYYIVLNVAGTTGINVSMFFNADTTATNYERMIVTDGAGVAADDAVIGGTTGTGFTRIEGHLELGIGGRAVWIGESTRLNSTAAMRQDSSLIWDTTSNVTSITFNASVASSLVVGTKVKAWKIKAS